MPPCSGKPHSLSRSRVCAAGCAALLAFQASVHGAESPAARDNTATDQQLLAAVRQKATRVLCLAAAMTNTPDLSTRICVQPLPMSSNTNTNAVVQAAMPVSDPVFDLRGLSSSTGKPLALLNGRWYGIGDVVTNGLQISRIGGDYVVLVDAHGEPRMVPLYHDRK